MQIIGDRSAFSEKLQSRITEVELLTKNNTGMTLSIAANYGGRWDIVQAVQQLIKQGVKAEDINETVLEEHLMLSDLPAPDLFIRTGGEHRISNFLLWQIAYTEQYFTDTLWPDFSEQHFSQAFDDYAARQRRFGRTGDQVEEEDA